MGSAKRHVRQESLNPPIVLVLVIVIVLDFFAISGTRATTTTRTIAS
jgi:hypothetical protein